MNLALEPSSSGDSIVLPALNRTTCTDYCRAALRARHNEFWWYFNGLAAYRAFSKPFRDGDDGKWWYRVKPGFAWPVDFFHSFTGAPSGMSIQPLLGWQYPVEHSHENSYVSMNVILDLSGYSLGHVDESKRRAIRKGMRALEVVSLAPGETAVAADAHEVWKSHTGRTGWNSAMSPDRFVASWAELAHWPGTTVLAARAKDGAICAWLIVRWIDDTVFFDTLASHSDRLENRPNDLIAFSCLKAAAEQGATHAHYSLKSNILSLEAFKQSLGFETKPFPAYLHLRYPVRLGLRLLRPRLYARLRGEESKESPATLHPSNT